jgi:hypothetical protein
MQERPPSRSTRRRRFRIHIGEHQTHPPARWLLLPTKGSRLGAGLPWPTRDTSFSYRARAIWPSICSNETSASRTCRGCGSDCCSVVALGEPCRRERHRTRCSSNSEAALRLLDPGEPSWERAPQRWRAGCRSASRMRTDAATTRITRTRASFYTRRSNPRVRFATPRWAVALGRTRSRPDVKLLSGRLYHLFQSLFKAHPSSSRRAAHAASARRPSFTPAHGGGVRR